MHARYYDPATGQFISPDTLVPDATNLFDYNRYMYARGNPLKYRDPSGHFSEEQLTALYGSDWRDQFTPEWQRLLLDVPGSQILGAQLGDVIVSTDAQGQTAQNVLVLGPSGSDLALWDPASKQWTPTTAAGQVSYQSLGLYRITGGETGAADTYWSYLTGGTNALGGLNGASAGADGYRLTLLGMYSTGGDNLARTSNLSGSWFMGRQDRAGAYMSNQRDYDSLDLSMPNLAEGTLTLVGVVQLAWAGITAGAVTTTGAGVALYGYQSAQFRDSYYVERCLSVGPQWCR